MRIVIFDDLPEGGAKRVVFEQVKGLSSNHVVDYISNDLPSIFPFERFAHEVFRFPLNLKEYSGPLRLLKELSYYETYVAQYRQISALIKKIDPDVVLVHPSKLTQAPGLLDKLAIPVAYFAEEWPRVAYEPDYHPLPRHIFKAKYENLRRRWIKHLDKEAVSHAGMVITTSNYMQQQLSKIYDREIKLLPLGVNTQVFQPLKKTPKSRNFFLFVGEFNELNGYPLLSPLVRRFHTRNVRFHKGRFRLTDASLKTLYGQAIATLCLAHNEPFGLSVLESLACETPVIAVNSGGYLDTVSHRKNGILIKPSTDALAKAMELLKIDGKLRDRLGKWGRLNVSRRYTWERHILQLESYLAEVIHG